MSTDDLQQWLATFYRPTILRFAKRLRANDTGQSGANQVGPYIPRPFLAELIPSLREDVSKLVDTWVSLSIDSHDQETRMARVVWYASKQEGRMTRLGGKSSALQDHDNTGAVAAFAFLEEPGTDEVVCRVWVARNADEDDAIESVAGSVERGIWQGRAADGRDLTGEPGRPHPCRLPPGELPEPWRRAFPDGRHILARAMELCPRGASSVDGRLLERRECEFELFKSIEDAIYLPVIRPGFDKVDQFLDYAKSALNRRASRGGRSFELQIKTIFEEEQLAEGRDFSYQATVDSKSKPDFLFPSAHAYRNLAFPTDQLRMLAVKTSLRERWHQIGDEAVRIKGKHLMTLQVEISDDQFQAIHAAGIKLVVPKGLHRRYPDAVKPHLQTLESFIDEVRALQR